MDPVDISQALAECLAELGWGPAHVAAAVGMTEAGVKKWLPPNGTSTPSGPTLLKLMRDVPGFAKRLGYSSMEAAA